MLVIEFWTKNSLKEICLQKRKPNEYAMQVKIFSRAFIEVLQKGLG